MILITYTIRVEKSGANRAWDSRVLLHAIRQGAKGCKKMGRRGMKASTLTTQGDSVGKIRVILGTDGSILGNFARKGHGVSQTKHV